MWGTPDWDDWLENSRTVTDGLRLPARLLICSEEKPETARRAGGGSRQKDAFRH